MDDASVAGPDFSGLHPFVFIEVRRDSDIHVRYDAVGWNLDFFWHLDNRLGLADGPALDELRGSGQISGVAFRSPLIDPGRNSVDFFLAQAAIIQEMAIFRGSQPRRHSPALNFVLDRPGPGASVFVGHKRHRGYFASPVALNAVRVENRGDVPAEGDSCVRRRDGRYSGGYRYRENGNSYARSDRKLPHNLPPGQLFWPIICPLRGWHQAKDRVSVSEFSPARGSSSQSRKGS